MTKAEAGRLGGTATAQKYGPTYMAEIGKLGAKVFWDTYRLLPVGVSRYAVVRKSDGVIVNFLNSSR